MNDNIKITRVGKDILYANVHCAGGKWGFQYDAKLASINVDFNTPPVSAEINLSGLSKEDIVNLAEFFNILKNEVV